MSSKYAPMAYFETLYSMQPKYLREQSSQQSKLQITLSFPCRANKTNLQPQFIISDTGCEVPFIYVLPVLSLNVSESVEVPVGKEKLKQIFLGPGTKWSSCLCSHQAAEMPLGVSVLSKGLLQYLSQREYNFCETRTWAVKTCRKQNGRNTLLGKRDKMGKIYKFTENALGKKENYWFLAFGKLSS